ncbi:unnamed protein product [Caretta caretta]
MVLIPLLQRCIQLLTLPVYLLSYLGLWDPLCKKIFPYLMAKCSTIYNRKLFQQKQDLFSNLGEFAGPSRELRLLEIGTGTGANFQFYPPGCRVTCTDPNPNFEGFLLKSISDSPHLRFERFMVASGEDLLPVADDSMDVVVCTLVLCSVRSIEQVLREVLRVLRLGEKLTASYNRRASGHKQELFGNLQEFAGPAGELTLLEIGTGTGANFQFYPPGCKITCTDTNLNFQRGLSKSMAQNQHLQFQRFLVAPGEDLNQVADSSMDAVVCTLVLCSVQSIEGVLKEVLRVLRPGGAFYFLEHVAADPSSWTYFWQQVFYPTWKLVFDGCCLTREPWKNLEQAKFSEIKLRHIQVPLYWAPVQSHIVGYAIK